MKITKSKLKQIIKEELVVAQLELEEGVYDKIKNVGKGIVRSVSGGNKREQQIMQEINKLFTKEAGGDPAMLEIFGRKTNYKDLGHFMWGYFTEDWKGPNNRPALPPILVNLAHEAGCDLIKVRSNKNDTDNQAACKNFQSVKYIEISKWDVEYFNGNMKKNEFRYKGNTISQLHQALEDPGQPLRDDEGIEADKAFRRRHKDKEKLVDFILKNNNDKIPDFGGMPLEDFKKYFQALQKYVTANLTAIKFLKAMSPKWYKGMPIKHMIEDLKHHNEIWQGHGQAARIKSRKEREKQRKLANKRRNYADQHSL